MKIFLIFALVLIASTSAEDSKPEADPKPLQIQWQAKYGEYGIESIVPFKYDVPVYRYGYQSIPLPSISYPSLTYSAVPYPLRMAYKHPGMAVTSYDPETFSKTFGYYPDH